MPTLDKAPWGLGTGGSPPCPAASWICVGVIFNPVVLAVEVRGIGAELNPISGRFKEANTGVRSKSLGLSDGNPILGVKVIIEVKGSGYPDGGSHLSGSPIVRNQDQPPHHEYEAGSCS